MAIPSKRVLITGVDGFTGIHLEKHMQKLGFNVFGTSQKKTSRENVYQMNLLDKVSIKNVINFVKPDYIIHLAAISFVAHGNASDFYQVNVIGTENLLGMVVESGIKPKKILIASSANVYGNTDIELIDESTVCEPINHYACSKLAMEKIVKNYFERLDIIITRPFNYTGPNQKEYFLIPKIVSHFKTKSKVIELGNLDVYRDYSSVFFVIESYTDLISSNEKSIIINVCSGRSVSLLDVISEMEKITSHKMLVKVNPSFVRSNEVKKITGDKSRLENIIGAKEPLTIKQLLETFFSDSEVKASFKDEL